jgi:hypothetical protein
LTRIIIYGIIKTTKGKRKKGNRTMKKQYEVVLTKEERLQLGRDMGKEWYQKQFVGMSKKELVAFCEKCGLKYMYFETGHGVPQDFYIERPGFKIATLGLHFDKHTRRVAM